MNETAQIIEPGSLWGVGLGPGDQGLLTLRAVELIGRADVVAYHSARHGRSIARSIAEPHMREGQHEEALRYPITVETTDHPGGYRGALEEFYEKSAALLAGHLQAGRSVAVLCEGDPFFYGSYMHMHKRLADRYPTEVVPAVTSVSAASARLGLPLVEAEETLTVLPGTLPPDQLATRLAHADSAAVMKLGRTFPAVRQALSDAGRLDDAWYVERATTERERLVPMSDVDPDEVPYFSLAVLPSKHTANQDQDQDQDRAPNQNQAHEQDQQHVRDRDRAAEAAAGAEATSAEAAAPTCGEVTVVGLGPAGPEWLTLEADTALAAADDIVGYTTYVDRVPARRGQRRHATDNKVEAERSAFALDLARRGSRVAVVSSGDPGVFAMASAVLEAAADPDAGDVPVRVLPGLTAAQAAAARVGAPLGHDYAVLSLSDRLKSWETIEARLRAVAESDLALAVYNPASRSRVRQLADARDLLLTHRAPETPVVMARAVGAPEEDVRVLRLDELDPEQVDMRCILLIGSSTTRVEQRPDGSRTVWTPRHYPM